MKYKAFEAEGRLKIPNTAIDTNAETRLLKGNDNVRDTESQTVRLSLHCLLSPCFCRQKEKDCDPYTLLS
jgi:hypothetical protein